MKTLYKSPIRGWVEVTEEQQKRLIKLMDNGILTMIGEEKQRYIESKFKKQ